MASVQGGKDFFHNWRRNAPRVQEKPSKKPLEHQAPALKSNRLPPARAGRGLRRPSCPAGSGLCPPGHPRNQLTTSHPSVAKLDKYHAFNHTVSMPMLDPFYCAICRRYYDRHFSVACPNCGRLPLAVDELPPGETFGSASAGGLSASGQVAGAAGGGVRGPAADPRGGEPVEGPSAAAPQTPGVTRGRRGGKRQGAGAPRGNQNRLVHGRRSGYLRDFLGVFLGESRLWRGFLVLDTFVQAGDFPPDLKRSFGRLARKIREVIT